MVKPGFYQIVFHDISPFERPRPRIHPRPFRSLANFLLLIATISADVGGIFTFDWPSAPKSRRTDSRDARVRMSEEPQRTECISSCGRGYRTSRRVCNATRFLTDGRFRRNRAKNARSKPIARYRTATFSPAVTKNPSSVPAAISNYATRLLAAALVSVLALRRNN